MKQTLYPKTKRVGKVKNQITITEKLDSSNLGLFKLNGELIVAQRNNVFNLGNEPSKILKTNNPGITYKGLVDWLIKNGDKILEHLYEGSGVFGEWLGMGHIKYNKYGFGKYYLFAKARIQYEQGQYIVSNIIYDLDLIPYALGGELPEDVDIFLVPFVYSTFTTPSVDELDKLYDRYKEAVGREVEGFIINISGNIQKYVRYKNGKLTKHTF